MGDPTARHSRAGRLFKWIAYFKTIYGMSVNLLDIFHIKAFQSWISPCWQTPHSLCSASFCPELHWLTVPGKARMGNQYHLLLIALIYTLHFYPWLKFSMDFAFLRWCFC